MVKPPKILSYRTYSPMIMKLGIVRDVLKPYKIYINDDPELTLTHFKTMPNLAKLVFVLILGQISGERLQDHWSSGFDICLQKK